MKYLAIEGNILLRNLLSLRLCPSIRCTVSIRIKSVGVLGCAHGLVFWTYYNLKSIIFWDMTPCSLFSCNRHSGGTYRFHLQGQRNNFSKNQQANRWQACLLKLFLRPWRWMRYVPPKRRLQLNRLHGIISHKTILFITTAVRTSNPIYVSQNLLPMVDSSNMQARGHCSSLGQLPCAKVMYHAIGLVCPPPPSPPLPPNFLSLHFHSSCGRRMQCMPKHWKNFKRGLGWAPESRNYTV
jgi:hypothetical protein